MILPQISAASQSSTGDLYGEDLHGIITAVKARETDFDRAAEIRDNRAVEVFYALTVYTAKLGV